MSRFWIRLLLCAGVGVAAIAAAAEGPPVGGQPASHVDILIRNGRVLDGLGSPAIEADVAVADGRIVFVGRLDPHSVRAARTIDAGGRVVAPGFVDPHAVGDPLATPAFENFLAMGVTTVALDRDGAGPAATDPGAWLDQVAAAGIGVNLATFVRYGALREQAGLGARADPDIAAIEALEAGLTAALDQAFGVSLGLEQRADLDSGELELRALARVAGARDRLVVVRVLDPDDALLDRSLERIVRMGRHARVHVADLRSAGGRGPLRAEELLLQFVRARAGRVRITADVDPYSASADAQALDPGTDPDLQARLLGDPYVAVGSGGNATGPSPGGHGAFAKFVEAQAGGLAGLPEAVRRMTSLPAAIVGLADRGRIAPGFAADLVVFDPAQVRARATPVEPLRLAEGFDAVIVNGRVARSGDMLDAGRHGVVLRPRDPERAVATPVLPPGRPVSDGI